MSPFRLFAAVLAGGVFALALSLPSTAPAADQSLGSAGSIRGHVVDPSGAVVPGALVELHGDLAQYLGRARTNERGEFSFPNIPQSVYRLEVTSAGFAASLREVAVHTAVPVAVRVVLRVATMEEAVQVEAPVVAEGLAVSRVIVNEQAFSRLPSASGAWGLGTLVSLTTPVVVSDSNGFLHPLGDHAGTTLSVDNQPITDQQGAVFSTQLPANAVESLEVIYGITPAEYGDRTGLVINAITRSGLGQKPQGSVSESVGTFGTTHASGTLGLGGDRFGVFTAINAARSDRFLDTPELRPLHAAGGNRDVFARFDYRPRPSDALHVNVSYARSAFDIPNTETQEAAGQDQRQRVRSFNVAPGWMRVAGRSALITVSPYARHDRVDYWPSPSPTADRPATIAQSRTLANAGLKADVAYGGRRHNVKAGLQASWTLLREDFSLGLTDPSFDPSQAPGLAPYDLTRGGSMFRFHGAATVGQQGLFLQDTVALGAWTLNLGARYDRYDGISHASLLQPRLGIAYRVPRLAAVVRAGYARSLQSPFNENLVLSSATGNGGLATSVFGASVSIPLHAGPRHQVNVGLQQPLGRHLALDLDAFWKRTRNSGCDLDSLFNTAIFFPIEFSESRMDGYSARLTLLPARGVSGFLQAGHTRARAFAPVVGGLIFNSPLPGAVGLLDHDQKLQAAAHLQYLLPGRLPWISATWRYDSGVVAGAVPDLASLLALSPNDQQTVGFYCGNEVATIGRPITSCASSSYGTRYVDVPAEGTADDLSNPPRVRGRHVIDLAVGTDDLLGRGGRIRWTARLSVLNLTDAHAMYNFLSTCAGTHFVPTRRVRAEVGLRF